MDITQKLWARSSVVVKALFCKPEGRGFDTRWGDLLNLPNPSRRTRPWGLIVEECILLRLYTIKYDNHATSLATIYFTCKHYARLYIHNMFQLQCAIIRWSRTQHTKLQVAKTVTQFTIKPQHIYKTIGYETKIKITILKVFKRLLKYICLCCKNQYFNVF
jgi:hypothetical protein